MRPFMIALLVAASAVLALAGQNPDVRISLEFQNGSNYVEPAEFQEIIVTIYLDNFGSGGGVRRMALKLDRTFDGILESSEVLHGGGSFNE